MQLVTAKTFAGPWDHDHAITLFGIAQLVEPPPAVAATFQTICIGALNVRPDAAPETARQQNEDRQHVGRNREPLTPLSNPAIVSM